jgi:hypothetical protein
MDMTRNQYDGTPEPVLDAVPDSRPELLALREALRAFFSSAQESELATRGMEAHLRACLDEVLARPVLSREPLIIDLSAEDLQLLAIVAGTMTAPYRAGMSQTLEATALAAILSPLAQRLLVLAGQIPSPRGASAAPGTL